MPKYLGFDFLSQALRKKDQLVSRMLITCAGHEEADTICSIPSKIDRDFVWYFVKAQVEKVPKEDPGSYLLEIISSRFGREPERFHNTRVIEYVPSSNPDSPLPSFLSDSFFELEEEIVREVCDYLNRHEVDVTKFDSCNTEKWQLEEMVMKDCFEEFLRRIPRFQDLVSRLKPRKVADPFIGKDGFLRRECHTICSRCYSDENSTNIDIAGIPAKETFTKLSIPEQYETEHYNCASPLIGSVYVSHDTHIEISNCENVSPMRQQKNEVILECNEGLQELQNYCTTVSWAKHQEYETAVKYQEKSFLEINQTETNSAEKDVSPPLAVESPPPNYRTEHKDNVNLTKQNADLEPCQLQQDELVFILSPRSQNKITRKVVVSSKFPDKISSLMLVAPNVDDKKLTNQDFAQGLSILSNEDLHSELELQLQWDLPNKAAGEIIDQLRFSTVYQERASPDHSRASPDFATKFKTKLKKLPWRHVYVPCADTSPMALEVTKEIELSPLLPCVTVKENFHGTNTSLASPAQRKSSGKPIVKNATKCSGMKTSKALDGNKKDSNIHSGIDDFVLLRTGVKSSSSSRCPPKAIVKAMKVDQRIAGQNDDTLTKENDLKDLIEVVEVSLTGDIQTAYNYIESHIRPCLLQLQEIGCVAPSYTTSNLTGDYTRFVLKQEEKRKVYVFNTDQSCDDKKYKMLVCLHILVTTADLIKDCGISVAQDYIKTMSTEYNKELDGALDQTTSKLVNAEQNLTNAKTFHPKVIAIYNYVQAWKSQPSTLTLDDKILVMIFRCFQEVSTSLMSKLQQLRGLKITAIERKSPLFPLLNNTHVVICDPTNIPDDFPWWSFASFITYEDKTEWLDKILFKKCVNVKKIVCLKGVLSKEQQKHMEYKIEDLQAFDHEVPKQETYTVIGSSKITKNVNLLSCLEQKCGIVIIEREYEKILKCGVTTSSKMCRQPDLILDQSASVIIENVINFTDEEGYKSIVDLALSTSFKCQMCSIILVSEKNRSSTYSFIGEVQSNLAKFHGCLMSMQLSFPHFVFDVFYSQSVEHTASLIRRLCEVTRDSSNVFSKQDWVRRNWLAEECSEHEKFLLGFPSLNSFSAQLMLNVMPLNILLTTPFESLKKALPWIPENVLKNFKETTECGLKVEEDEVYPIQIPQFPEGDIVDDEHIQYHFSPVIENTEENAYNEESSFLQSEMPSDYFNTHFPSFLERIPQQLNQDMPCVEKVAKRNFSQHETIFEKSDIGNSNMFTEAKQIHPDDSSNYYDMYYAGVRQSRSRVRSPVRSTFEEVIGDLSVTIGNNRRATSGGNTGKLKHLLRFSKNLKRGSEMPDAVGVVQPKRRNITMADLKKTGSYVSQPAATARGRGPRYAKTIPNDQYQKQNRTEFLFHSMYENPVQKKEKKLTYEIVPGAKNGQTRLAFV